MNFTHSPVMWVFTEPGAVLSLSLRFRDKNDNKAKSLPRSFWLRACRTWLGQKRKKVVSSKSFESLPPEDKALTLRAKFKPFF